MQIIKISQNVNSVELSGDSLTVYHRTKDQDIAGSICDVGFIAGGGAAYGTGIYTTYTLQSSLQNHNLTAYGGELLKAKVNINGFLIFDYDISQQVYGSNYKLIDQIRNVIGTEKFINSSLDNKKQLDTIQQISNDLSNTKFTSDLASTLAHRFRLDKSGLNGIIFTGRHDGKVCLAYKELLVVPVAHAWIDGKTYKNPIWKSCGERSQEELEKLQLNEGKAEQFRTSRQKLLNDLRKLSDNGTIDLKPENYPSVPIRIFEAALTNFLYEDDNRIQRLSPTLRSQIKDVIDIEFMVKKLRSAPTVHWKEFQNLDTSIKAKIPYELVVGIWEDFILANPGYWSKIPEDIRSSIPKSKEAEYWKKLVNKNPQNWKHVHPEIATYMENQMNLTPPQGLMDSASSPLGSSGLSDSSDEVTHETEEIDVPVSALGWIQEEISKLNKRAGRLGLPPITHEVISEDLKNRTQKIKIIGNIPYMKGWKLISRVSRMEDENGFPFNIVETLSDEPAPESMNLEDAEMRCDDCGHTRKRKECYIVKNESATQPHGVKQRVYDIGEYLMIGSTCLRDFIGDTGGKTTPDSIAKYAQQFHQMLNLFKEGSQYQNKTDDDIRKEFKNKGAPIVFFLSKVMQLEDQFGFVSRNQAYTQGVEATANLAWQMCIDLKTDQKYSTGVNAGHLATIYSALAWIQSLPEQSQSGNKKEEFLYNLKKSCELGTVFGKKRQGNIGVVSWLPTAYKRSLDEKIDYNKVSGEEGEEIFFEGTILSRRPVLVQISQQVMQGKNTMQDYIIAENADGRMVSWMEDKPIQANVNQPIYLKGKVQNNLYINGSTASVLSDVEEISETAFESVRPHVEKRLKELSDKENKIDDKPTESFISPKGNYQHGDKITEKYKVRFSKPANRGQMLYFLDDNYGKTVSTFTDIPLGEKGDFVTLSGTVQINGQYINLVGISIYSDSVTDTSPTVSSPVMTPYQDGQQVEDDFQIISSKPADYGSTLYNLTDSYGRKVSAFIKGNIGNVGDTVRLIAKVKINGAYTNLQRVKIVPRQTTSPLTPSQQATSPVNKPSSTLPIQPSGTQQTIPPNSNDPQLQNNAKNQFNWYKVSKNAGIFDKLNPFNKQNDQATTDIYDDQRVADPNDITDLSQEAPSTPKYRQPENMDLDKAYDMFADSYQKATGKAWEKSKFLNRANGWVFYGDDAGYIAVRPQRSGLYKLVGIAGDDTNPTAKGRSLIKAFKDLMSENKPTWGMVSNDLKGMAERMGLKSPAPFFTKQLIKYIPQEMFGGAELKGVLPDGGIQFEYSDIGSATKYFIANDAYFQWLKQSVDSNSKIPRPAKFMLKKLLDKMANGRSFIKTASIDSFNDVENSIDLSEI